MGKRLYCLTFGIMLTVILGISTFLQAATTTNNFTVTPGAGQITKNTVYNDVWMSPWLNTTPSIIELFKNDTYIANVTLNGKVTMDDGYFNGDESIHIGVDGEGGVGGAPDNKADYKFWFTGVEGTISKGTEANPITGQLTIGALDGNVDFTQYLDLMDGGNFSFSDIHFEITYTGPNKWQFDKIQVGSDADVVSAVAPEPTTMLLFGFGFLGLLGVAGLKKKDWKG
jgi:hypothetical protein